MKFENTSNDSKQATPIKDICKYTIEWLSLMSEILKNEEKK